MTRTLTPLRAAEAHLNHLREATRWYAEHDCPVSAATCAAALTKAEAHYAALKNPRK